MWVSDTPELARRNTPPVRTSTRFAANATQLERLNRVLHWVWHHDPFYRCKWRCAGLTPRELDSLEALAHFPFTTRAELLADQKNYSPLGTNLTCSPAHIKHIHRSSGTTRAPIFWGDTAESWNWVTRASQSLFDLAGVRASDRVLMLLRFGVFSGPWIIRAGAQRLGCCTFVADPDEPNLESIIERFCPGVIVTRAGQGSAGRLPALAPDAKVIITSCDVPTDRANECFSRYGLTEAGSVAGECAVHSGMHLLEDKFIAEVIDPVTTDPLTDGAPGELVLTTLGRVTQPIIRYRTGDRVRLLRNRPCDCGRTGALLIGGVTRITAVS